MKITFQRDLFKDTYHYLLKTPWRSFIGTIFMGFITINTFFTVLYTFDEGGIANARPKNFLDHFFFSVQTLGTIGYGHMYPMSTYAHTIVVFETFFGILSTALITGVMFARFAVPKARVIFSNFGLFHKHHGKPVFMFRVANERGNQIVEARIHVVLLRDEVTLEGISWRKVTDLRPERSHTPVFTYSWSVVCPIDASSPLHGLTSEQIKATNASIAVTLVGIDNISGQTIHARHMYTHDGLLWNHRFADVVQRDSNGNIKVDYSKFHHVLEVADEHKIQSC